MSYFRNALAGITGDVFSATTKAAISSCEKLESAAQKIIDGTTETVNAAGETIRTAVISEETGKAIAEAFVMPLADTNRAITTGAVGETYVAMSQGLTFNRTTCRFIMGSSDKMAASTGSSLSESWKEEADILARRNYRGTLPNQVTRRFFSQKVRT
jgi:hypothetical protein